jgi:cyanuric acid amidohydrolase
MGASRKACAVGIAFALGEVSAASVEEALQDPQSWSSVASASAGIELRHNEVVVLGMAAGWGGDLVVGHAVMRDAIDADAVRQALAVVGLDTAGTLTAEQRSRLVNVLAKAEASYDGSVRGERHTMLTDTDLSATRHARAAVGGVIAAVAGTTRIYVSGGAEHQGPPGGGPVAAIARRPSAPAAS